MRCTEVDVVDPNLARPYSLLFFENYLELKQDFLSKRTFSHKKQQSRFCFRSPFLFG